MDAAYIWQSQQVGVPPHPLLLRGFVQHEQERPGKGEPSVLALGGKDLSGKDPPIRDADVVSVCLAVRSLSRTASLPLVRLDLTGELISCEGARTIAAILQVSSSLCSVLLRHTHVGDDGAAALGAALGSSMLHELDLGECAVTDAGIRYVVRGMQVHGTPHCLRSLLLDGNAVGDAGAIEVISLVEESSSLHSISIHPAMPRYLSKEVDAALQVACELAGVNLEYRGRPVPLETLMATARRPRGKPPAQLPQASLPPEASVSRHACPDSTLPPSSAAPKQVPDVRSSEHLASWMAATERELREMKWLMRSSSARLDGQHKKLMSELEKLHAQLDVWTAGNASDPSEEARLDVLEARFDAIEQLVGREQSECAQMWQLVEVAAGAGRK
mmetsp:Transcript_23510/g.44311  ORF Transcript_23510/g.44311 Transcript_23510/m.44311 type:complete len:388 (+) Transcript_23510:82-1245(+)